jgi:hypothetical protein
MNTEKKSQLDKFKEAARHLETDDDEERFEERLKKIVKQTPVSLRTRVMGMILTSNLLRLNYALTLGLSSIQSPLLECNPAKASFYSTWLNHNFIHHVQRQNLPQTVATIDERNSVVSHRAVCFVY